MINTPHQPSPGNVPPVFTPPTQPKSPLQMARTIADCIRAGLVIGFWAVLGAAGAGAAFICIRVIVWSVERIQAALGIGGG